MIKCSASWRGNENREDRCKMQASTLAKLLFLRGNADIMQADDLPVASGKGRKRRLRCLEEDVNSDDEKKKQRL